MAARLKESLPAYKEAFVRSLLRKNTYTPDYIRERIEYLGIGLPSGSLLLMAISVEEAGKGQDMIEESITKLRIGDRIGQSLPEDRPHIVSEVAEGLYVAIVNGGASDTAAWFASAEKVIRQLQTGLSRKASIGIGRPCPAIEHIHRAYDEAAEALRYRRLAGGREVIYIEEVSLEGTPLLAYPKEKEESLTSYIINGETEQARRVFAAMTQEIGAQGSKLHYHQIQQAYAQVLGSLVAAAHHMKLDLNQVTGEKNNLYSVLLDQNDRQATISWLDGIIVRLCAEIGNAFRNKNNRHVDQAVRMVTEELARPVTLAAVAERLKLNPSYLSRIFKEQKGESFSDFVTRIRMDKGKQLLLETDLKIKEIGEQVGYQKTDYFIRLFKEFTGMTPGEYRQNRSLPQS
ncbi:helix-turn-helix domain-containing protein [Paenibacillus sp. CC-CFT747]|nr:helix-turn-helix domain-containing protein [Paenibacillus sp. CC-CFT747]